MEVIQITEKWGKNNTFIMDYNRDALRTYFSGRYCPVSLIEELAPEGFYSIKDQHFFEKYTKLIDNMVDNLIEWLDEELAVDVCLDNLEFLFLDSNEESILKREIEVKEIY